MRDSGHTMVELLVSMTLSSVVLALVARDLGFHAHTRREMDLYAETQQALSTAMTFVTQELRQAGACMPELGDFIALEGTNSGDRDILSMRIGLANENSLQCTRNLLRLDANQSETTLKLEDASQFKTEQWLYIINASGHGNFFKIGSVDYTNNTLSLQSSLDTQYGKGSGVYALEERRYAIVETDGVPILTLSIDGGTAMPLAQGIEKLDVRYRLDPCPPCLEIDQPASDEIWRSVREVELTVGARSIDPGPDGEYVHLDAKTTIKPRNLI